MGRVNAAWVEAQERGWNEVDRNVCEECVDQSDLWRLAEGPTTDGRCDYCDVDDKEVLPVAAIQGVLYSVLGSYYAEPNQAGTPYSDGAYFVDPIDTREVLGNLGFEPTPALLADIVEADLVDAWVPAANGHWAAIHEHQVKLGSWSNFAHVVKHQTRFHFQRVTGEGHHDEIKVAEMLEVVAEELEPLIRTIEPGTLLYRARHLTQEECRKLDAKMMGAAPKEVASAGRMNPAGIPYFYGAFEPATALAEIGIPQAERNPVVAAFRVNRPLRVVDLTQLPNEPSVFSIDLKDEREKAMFLGGFVHSITQPVAKNGQEHIDYVPSQVVCEYLAQAFAFGDGQTLDGLKFPSAIHPDGVNLVVFPSGRWYEPERFGSLDYVGPV